MGLKLSKLEIAYNFAVRAHQGQFRKGSGIPYVTHCLSVVHRLSNLEVVDEHVLIAACLHDIVEDTKFTEEDIRNMFGSRVSKIVRELTNPVDLAGYEDKKSHLLKFSMISSKEAIMVKFVDRICNVEDYYHAGKHSYALKYATQAKSVFKAIVGAHIGTKLGLFIDELSRLEIILGLDAGHFIFS